MDYMILQCLIINCRLTLQYVWNLHSNTVIGAVTRLQITSANFMLRSVIYLSHLAEVKTSSPPCIFWYDFSLLWLCRAKMKIAQWYANGNVVHVLHCLALFLARLGRNSCLFKLLGYLIFHCFGRIINHGRPLTNSPDKAYRTSVLSIFHQYVYSRHRQKPSLHNHILTT